jgi:hypothetical protein
MSHSQSKSQAHASTPNYRPQIHQQILMDWQGFILESTDTIFSTLQLHHSPSMDWSHFLSSIYPSLQLLKLDSPEIFFPRIGSITNFLNGIYDCSFMRVEWGDNDKIIVWNIFDYSNDFNKIQEAQQRFNDIRMREIY